MLRWDVFISHASEDKAEVARPLADALRSAGLRVWLDQFELRLGDSLRSSIEAGLAQSRFGIVVLSPTFLSKRWPMKELNGLTSLEEDDHKVILPVWHRITQIELAKQAPILADTIAADTADGISKVASQIIAEVMDPANGSPTWLQPTVASRLVELMETSAGPQAITAFLLAHPALIRHAVGGGSSAVAGHIQATWPLAIGPCHVDLALPGIQNTPQCATTGASFASVPRASTLSTNTDQAQMSPRQLKN